MISWFCGNFKSTPHKVFFVGFLLVASVRRKKTKMQSVKEEENRSFDSKSQRSWSWWVSSKPQVMGFMFILLVCLNGHQCGHMWIYFHLQKDWTPPPRFSVWKTINIEVSTFTLQLDRTLRLISLIHIPEGPQIVGYVVTQIILLMFGCRVDRRVITVGIYIYIYIYIYTDYIYICKMIENSIVFRYC